VTNRHRQIQSVVENILLEGQAWDAFTTGTEMGLSDLFNADEVLSRKIASLRRELRLARSPAAGVDPTTITILQKNIDKLMAARGKKGLRRFGRTVGLGGSIAKGLGKGFVVGIPMGIASSLASNVMDRFTQGYGGIGLEKGKEPQYTELPDYGLNIK